MPGEEGFDTAMQCLAEMGRIRTRVRHLNGVTWRDLPEASLRMHLQDLRHAHALLWVLDLATGADNGDDEYEGGERWEA